MKNIVSAFASAGLVLCCLVYGSLALAVESKGLNQVTVDKPTPIIFGNSLIKPWGMQLGGLAQGLLVDLQCALSIETGFSHQVELQPYARVIQPLYYGDVDMAALFAANIDLSRVIKVAPIIEASVIIVGKAGTAPINSISELSGKLTGHMRGSKYGPSFDNASFFTKVPIDNMQQGYRCY
jgi:polar amino acid transport system substrate-binding protein